MRFIVKSLSAKCLFLLYMIVVKAFGHVKEVLGSELEVNRELIDVKSLRDYLGNEYPTIVWSTVAIAVNKKYVQDQDPISLGDEIALIPPVSGG
ncbi:MAG: MoaD/ThiS family protein [Bacteroidota bacterium]